MNVFVILYQILSRKPCALGAKNRNMALGVTMSLLLAGWVDLARSDEANLMDFDIEALMNMQVTSVSKQAQKLSDSAAAIFVITREDIRRSGATSVPEVLRLAPGLNVA